MVLTPEAFIKEEEDEHCLIDFGKGTGGRGRGEGRRGAEMDASPLGLPGVGSPAGHETEFEVGAPLAECLCPLS